MFISDEIPYTISLFSLRALRICTHSPLVQTQAEKRLSKYRKSQKLGENLKKSGQKYILKLKYAHYYYRFIQTYLIAVHPEPF